MVIILQNIRKTEAFYKEYSLKVASFLIKRIKCCHFYIAQMRRG